MISQFVSSSPTLGSMLTVQSRLGILFSSLSALAPLVLSVFLSKINERKKIFKVCEMNDVRGLI